jgi:hypothetical protein
VPPGAVAGAGHRGAGRRAPRRCSTAVLRRGPRAAVRCGGGDHLPGACGAGHDGVPEANGAVRCGTWTGAKGIPCSGTVFMASYATGAAGPGGRFEGGRNGSPGRRGRRPGGFPAPPAPGSRSVLSGYGPGDGIGLRRAPVAARRADSPWALRHCSEPPGARAPGRAAGGRGRRRCPETRPLSAPPVDTIQRPDTARGPPRRPSGAPSGRREGPHSCEQRWLRRTGTPRPPR